MAVLFVHHPFHRTVSNLTLINVVHIALSMFCAHTDAACRPSLTARLIETFSGLSSPRIAAALFFVALTPVTANAQSGPDVQLFEDWRVSCPQGTADNCRVWQRVQVQHGDLAQDVLSVSLAPATDGLALLIQTPLDVFLPADFGFRIDGQNERRVRYRNCNEAGCWVVMPADGVLLRQLRSGITAEAALSLVEGETVRISFSLRGITAALAAFEEARAAYD